MVANALAAAKAAAICVSNCACSTGDIDDTNVTAGWSATGAAGLIGWLSAASFTKAVFSA